MSSTVEQIKSRLNIVDVVGSYVRLQKAGVNFKAPCPFHREKTPSFFVSPTREGWHCFGCNRSGDVFNFVMEIEGIEFPEALKILAGRAGVELRHVNLKYKNERTRILQMLNDAKKFYSETLFKNKNVVSYLKERGLKEETIGEFEIGYVPEGWRNLADFLKSKGYSESEMEKAGMVIKKLSVVSRQSSTYYDRFRNRIMFPLFNFSGQIVGFSGRIFGQESENTGGKYINTPQTILYDKSKILYGFDRAKIEIKKNNCCILTEGQMDVIMSHQAGIRNVVAVSGTSLTLDHLRIIKRLTDNLAIAFDKDEAGFAASKRGMDMAIAEGFEIKVILIPFGKDPADTIKENRKIWEQAIKNSKNIIEFYLESLSEKIKDSRELKKAIENTVFPYLALISSEIEKAHWIGEIARKLNISEEPVWEQLKKFANVEFLQTAKIQHLQVQTKSRLELLKNKLKGFILWQKKNENKELKEEMEKIIKKYEFDLKENNKNTEKLIFEAELFYGGMKDLEKELKTLEKEIRKENIKFQLEEIAVQIKKLETTGAAADSDELKNYLNQFHELIKKLNEFK